MLRTTLVTLETWRAHYHRINIPRRAALHRYIQHVEAKRVTRNRLQQQKQQQQQQKGQSAQLSASAASSSATAMSHLTAPSGAPPVPSPAADSGAVPHKYNRFFVNDEWNFVAQHAFVEDPEVTEQRRAALPDAPTAENLWKQPRVPYFEPLVPFLRVVDYGKDPDAKFMKPTNVPRWKDFMARKTPVVPRTWY